MQNNLESKVALYNSQCKYNNHKVVTSYGIAKCLIEKFSIASQNKTYCRSVIICNEEMLNLSHSLNPNTRTAIKFADRYFCVRYLNGVTKEDSKLVSIRVFKVDKSTFEKLNSFHKSLAIKEGKFYAFYLACVAPKKEDLDS